MKNLLKLLGFIITLVTICGLGITACDWFGSVVGNEIGKHQIEEDEIPTKGRLTITGLNHWNGYEIMVSPLIYSQEELVVCKRMIDRYTHSSTEHTYSADAAFVASDKSELKVYIKVSDKIYNSYNGNDQNVIFFILLQKYSGSLEVDSARGYVTVNFTNGVGGNCEFIRGEPPKIETPPEIETVTEVETVGRLTITGLDNYEGMIITGGQFQANNGDSKNFIAAEKAVFYSYSGNSYSYYSLVNGSKVVSGQVVFKVYSYYWYDNSYSNYNGNDKNVNLYLSGSFNRLYASVHNINFTNGVGTGTVEFTPY